MKIKFLMVPLILINLYISSCPFKITNDSEDSVFIAAENKSAIYLVPNKTMIIDPSVMGGWLAKWLKSEKLYIYFPMEEKGRLYQAYELTEIYCSDIPEENQFTINDVLTMSPNITKRFKVKEFERPHIEHVHNHAH